MVTDKEIREAGYICSNRRDDNGKNIYQGSIIHANGYESSIEDKNFHCVEYEDGRFTSDIYGDSDSLDRYDSIIVIGHVLDYVELYNSGGWSGNLGAGFKSADDIGFYDSAKCDAITAEGRIQLRHLIDVVWNFVTESTEVPATVTADELIDKAFKIKK